MEGGKGVVGIRDLFRWVGDGRESSSGQKGGGTKDLAVLELLFPGPWVTGGGRDERPRRSPFELRYSRLVNFGFLATICVQIAFFSTTCANNTDL